MKDEFKRFGIEKFKILTAILEILGGVGLLVGLKYPLILSVSSGGLFVLMILAVRVRIKLRDSLIESLPAIILVLINLYILIESLKSAGLSKT